jgi:LysM repeat protein
MKKLIITSIFLLCLNLVQAQQVLYIRNTDNSFYLDHTVAAKEGLYSIGRLYNVNPKHIAGFNKIDLNKGLAIGEVVRIPLSDTNFTNKTNKGAPIYYAVQANDGLQKISNANRKVPVASLRKWNGLTSDNVPAGTALIIGYLVTKEAASFATLKQGEIISGKPVAASTEVAVKTVPPEVKPVVETQKSPEKDPAPKPQAVVTPVKEKAAEVVASTEEVAAVSGTAGYFKPFFDQQIKSAPASRNSVVTAGIFKTISGWQDAKFYMLIDGVAAGNIIRVINPDNNKIIYAKVLGEMNGIRQNQGLGTRISSAAASALGVSNTEKFTLQLNY